MWVGGRCVLCVLGGGGTSGVQAGVCEWSGLVLPAAGPTLGAPQTCTIIGRLERVIQELTSLPTHGCCQ